MTVMHFFPIRRRLDKMARPALVAINLRNPHFRFLRKFEGWYVRFIIQFCDAII